MRIILRRSILIIAATILALALNAYLFLHTLFAHRAASSTTLAVSNECDDQVSDIPKTNPNKMLFISCGGFLE